MSNRNTNVELTTEVQLLPSTFYPQFFLGDIQIYNGNNIDVLQSLGLDLSKCIFVTDPPFNIGYHYDQYNDKMNEDDYYNWLADILGTQKQVIIHYPEYLYKHSFNIGLFPDKVVSWVYNSNTGKQHRDIAFLSEKRTKHSAKPNEIRNRIFQMFPTQNKIELFAREKHEGWDVWGNEVESSVAL